VPNTVIGRYAFAVYDEGGLVNMNLGGFPTYANMNAPALPGRPTSPTRRLPAKHPSEQSEIMLAAFTPNDPCHAPNFSPNHTNVTLATGVLCSLLNVAKNNPDSYSASALPHGLSLNTTNGNITGAPTDPGNFTISLIATNECGSDTLTLHLTINGFPSPGTTPWPVNLARKGTVGFADLTALSSNPADITTAQINQLMGWRNYATTQQPSSASFNNPSFPSGPPDDPIKDLYAKYFLGAVPPFTTPFTGVSAVSWSPPGSPPRTDQAVMTRQELIRLQRTTLFSQNLLQYLGTFSREYNRPAPDWSQTLAARWDMNNLATALPDAWIIYPGNHGIGHAYGLQRHSEFAQLFGLVWVNGSFQNNKRFTDPNYYGRWKYINDLNQWPANPDFFQVINNAMKIGNGGVSPDPKQVFTAGAAIIDQYDTEDVYDPDPNCNGGACGNTITIIDTVGNANPSDYVYGVEGMSYDDPLSNPGRPPFAPGPGSPPLPPNYTLLNRRFENVGEFGYAYNPGSTTPSKTLDFASSASKDKPLLDFFTYNAASVRAGIVNLNTRNAPVLASIIRGAWLHDPGSEILPPDPTYLVSQADALAAGQAIVGETTSNPALTRADVARLAAAAAAALHGVPGASADETKQTIARALAEVGQARTWNLMIDVIAQTGNYAPGTPDLTDPTKFIVQGEKRYWLHIALDRDDGTVLGTQLEEVID
jgi:hypothetical protein